jgi:hypothetical protein
MTKHIIITFDERSELASFPDKWTEADIDRYANKVLEWRKAWYDCVEMGWHWATPEEIVPFQLAAEERKVRIAKMRKANS